MKGAVAAGLGLVAALAAPGAAQTSRPSASADEAGGASADDEPAAAAPPAWGEPSWTARERRRLEAEVERRLAGVRTYGPVLGLSPAQEALLADLQAELPGRLDAALAEAWAAQRDAVRAALDPRQWQGWSRLPPLQAMAPGELRELLELRPGQVKALKAAEDEAERQLRRWRGQELRRDLRAWVRDTLTPAQRLRLNALAQLDARLEALRRQAAAELGEEALAALGPDLDALLAARREEAWRRYELLEAVEVARATDGPDAAAEQLLAAFRAERAALREAAAAAAARLREDLGPAEEAKLVAIGLLE